MYYNTLKYTQDLFDQYKEELHPTQYIYLSRGIRLLTTKFLLFFLDQQKNLKQLQGILKLTIGNSPNWNRQKFMEDFVEKPRREADRKKTRTRHIMFKLCDALETMRNLFDGDISFYRSDLSPFKDIHVEQTQIEQIRMIMQEITQVHIQEQIDRIEKELERSETSENRPINSGNSPRFFKESNPSSVSQPIGLTGTTPGIDDGKTPI